MDKAARPWVRLAAALSVLSITFGLVWPDVVGRYLFASGPVPGRDLTLTLVLGAVVWGWTLLSVKSLELYGRTSSMAAMGVMGATVNVALTVILVPAWGLQGAALATFLAYACLLGLTGMTRLVPAYVQLVDNRVRAMILLVALLSIVIVSSYA